MKRRASPYLALALCAAAQLAWTRVAHAEPLPLELDWSGPDGCPTTSDVRSELERIAHAREGAQLSAVTVRGRIEHTRAAYVLKLETVADGLLGTKRLEAARCQDLLAAATLVIALTFGEDIELVAQGTGDPPREAAETPPKSSDPSDAPSPTQPAPAASVSALAPAPRGRRFGWELGAGARGLRGLERSPSLGPYVEFRAGPRRISGSVSFAAFLPRESRFEGVDLRSSAVVLSVGTCLALVERWTRVGVCGLVEGGRVTMSAAPVLDSREAHAPWYAASPSLELSWMLGAALALRVAAGAAVSLGRPRFVIDGLGTVHETATFAPGVGLGVAYSRW
jgi:hypothetical protein